MPKKYKKLLSPLKVRNTVLRNRLTASPSKPHFLQGPEPYPTETVITHFAKKAKNGAALVTCTGASLAPVPAFKDYEDTPVTGPSRFQPGNTRSMGNHFTSFDVLNGHCQHYLSQLTEAIHFYGAKATMGLLAAVPPQFDVSTGIPTIAVFGDASVSTTGKEIPTELLESMAEAYGNHAAVLKEVGFDGVFLHSCYRMTHLGRFLSPLTNQRTDQYGGSLENRARFIITVADSIKRKCGDDFLIEAIISGSENYPGGQTLDDAIAYAKLFAGHIDLLQVRAGDIDPAHPTGYNPERTPFLYMAEAIKKSGADIAVVTIGGYQDLDICEDVIASGKADFIAMARSWISNPEYGRLAYEGRNEDIVPCLRCNACHRSSYADPWTSVCAVNPALGLEHKIERMVEPPIAKRKVAIVGGGIAGMEAALIAAGRGHEVTLYEKSAALGGLIKTADNVSFKWPQKNFKEYLIRQVSKSGVRVLLNNEATPEMLKDKGYDAVLAAVGSEPVVPPIPGVDGSNVVFAADVYGSEDSLAEKVVVIGGGEVGVETGMHLAEKGHRVTVLEMQDTLAPDAVPIHFYTMFRDAWEKLENFSSILKARCTGITADGVTYVDDKGTEHSIEAGSVVIAAGMKAKNDLALEFCDAGERFYMIGDCETAGNIQKATRSAFSTASTL